MESRALSMLSKILSLRGEPETTFTEIEFETADEDYTEDDATTGVAKKKKKATPPPFTLYKAGSARVLFAFKNRMIGDREIQEAVLRISAPILIFVLYSPPSQSVIQRIRSFVAQKKVVYLFHIHQLQFDIATHRMAVPHRILTEDQRRELFAKYKISNPREQLPWIDSQDAMAKWYGAMPGDVLEITRHSDTGGASPYWRYCVVDANLS